MFVSVVSGILGGDVLVVKYGVGVFIGVLFLVSGIGGLGVFVGFGFYLFFNIVFMYSLGILMWFFIDLCFGLCWVEDMGILFVVGFIVGEVFVGVGFFIVKVVLVGG